MFNKDLPIDLVIKYKDKQVAAHSFLALISPFVKEFSIEKPDFKYFLDAFYEKEDYEKLSDNALKNLIEIGVENMLAVVKESEELMYPSNMMPEKKFEETKLEYLIRNGEEPTVITEIEVKKLMEHIEGFLREIHDCFFFLGDKESNSSIDFEYLYIRYLSRCLTDFDHVATGHVAGIGEFYLENLSKIKIEDLEIYLDFRKCPISEIILNKRLSTYKCNNMMIFLRNKDRLKLIISEENYEEILREIKKEKEAILSNKRNANELLTLLEILEKA